MFDVGLLILGREKYLKPWVIIKQGYKKSSNWHWGCNKKQKKKKKTRISLLHHTLDAASSLGWRKKKKSIKKFTV